MLTAARGLSVLGVLLSAYLTFEHYTSSTTLACSETGSVNCALVTSSRWSTFLGVPVSLLGLLFFVAVTVSLLVPGRSSTTVVRLRLVACGGGVAFVLYLVWAELFRINAICLWCTGVHVVTVALFVVLVFAAALEE